MNGPVFDAAFLAELERLALLVRRLRPGRGAPHPAASGAVRDWRAYRPGDELRAIDWPAYARLDRLLVKQFESEEPRELTLVLDSSASMAGWEAAGLHAADACWRWTLRAAGALACLALVRHHPVALFAFRGPEVLAHSAPVRGAGARARLLALLAGLRPRGGGGPPAALAQLVRHRRRRGLAVVLTDALWPGDPAAPLGRLMAGGLEPVVLLVDEGGGGAAAAALQSGAAVLLRDAETGEQLALQADPELLAAHARALAEHHAAFAAACARRGIPVVRASPREPLGAVLRELLRAGALD